MYAGDSIASPNGQYSLVVQPDGNAVVYGPEGARWSSWFGRQGYAPEVDYGIRRVTQLVLQTDGNLVGYGPDGPWSSQTYGFSGNLSLNLQDDGNLVIYRSGGSSSAGGSLWASGTWQTSR